MKYRVTHETAYAYGDAVPVCQNVVHLTPRDTARQICRSRPVQTRCLQWAISIGADDGIWGGLSEEERRSPRRRQRSGRNRATDQRTPPPPDVLAAQTASRQRTTNAAAALPPHAHRTDPSRPSS